MKKLLIVLCSVFLLLLSPTAALAQDVAVEEYLGVPCKYVVSGQEVLSLGCIPALFMNIFTFAVSAAGVVALFMLVWSGYKIVFSGGDPKQLEGARQTATYAIIGLVLVILSYFILSFIGMITGLECITWFGFDQCVNPVDTSDPDPNNLLPGLN